MKKTAKKGDSLGSEYNIIDNKSETPLTNSVKDRLLRDNEENNNNESYSPTVSNELSPLGEKRWHVTDTQIIWLCGTKIEPK